MPATLFSMRFKRTVMFSDWPVDAGVADVANVAGLGQDAVAEDGNA
jgi:hypothetical protein